MIYAKIFNSDITSYYPTNQTITYGQPFSITLGLLSDNSLLSLYYNMQSLYIDKPLNSSTNKPYNSTSQVLSLCKNSC